MVKQSANTLLDASPFSAHVLKAMEAELARVPGVLNVHELRCWEVKRGYHVATVHLIIDPELEEDDHTEKYCDDECAILHDKMTVVDHAKAILHKYGVHSSIVQSEFPKKGNFEWAQANDPCFDYVCDTTDCIKKGRALSNAIANVKKSGTGTSTNSLSPSGNKADADDDMTDVVIEEVAMAQETTA